VAAKHDGKHARANMWVTHQNLARQKGGRPGYQFKEKKVFTGKQVAVAPKPNAEQGPAVQSGTPASPASGEGVGE
jgi:hypothetical protein